MINSDKETNNIIYTIKYVFRNEFIRYLVRFSKLTVYFEVFFFALIVLVSKYPDNYFAKNALIYLYKQRYSQNLFEYVSYFIIILCASLFVLEITSRVIFYRFFYNKIFKNNFMIDRI